MADFSWRTGSIFSCCKGLWDCRVLKPITTKHQSVFWLVSQSWHVGHMRWHLPVESLAAVVLPLWLALMDIWNDEQTTTQIRPEFVTEFCCEYMHSYYALLHNISLSCLLLNCLYPHSRISEWKVNYSTHEVEKCSCYRRMWSHRVIHHQNARL